METFTIRLKNCAFFARHGMMDEERSLGQRFYVDVEMTIAPTGPLEADSIAHTVHYGHAFAVIEEIMTGRPRILIETLAHECARALAERFPQIRRVEVTVRKPNAPVAGILDHVEVTVAWP